uniref:Uncharacterized protein n=1 Tax=Palpitomonas bilix TaxID=652834 RepID=A0A7S3DK76_9EUKA
MEKREETKRGIELDKNGERGVQPASTPSTRHHAHAKWRWENENKEGGGDGKVRGENKVEHDNEGGEKEKGGKREEEERREMEMLLDYIEKDVRMEEINAEHTSPAVAGHRTSAESSEERVDKGGAEIDLLISPSPLSTPHFHTDGVEKRRGGDDEHNREVEVHPAKNGRKSNCVQNEGGKKEGRGVVERIYRLQHFSI